MYTEKEMDWLGVTAMNTGFTSALIGLTGLIGTFFAFLGFSVVVPIWVWKRSKLAAAVSIVLNVATILFWDWIFSQTEWGPLIWFLH